MIRFLADEDFNGRIVRGAFLRKSELELVRAQDIVDLKGADDSHILRWAWDNQRALLTHDARTLRGTSVIIFIPACTPSAFSLSTIGH